MAELNLLNVANMRGKIIAAGRLGAPTIVYTVGAGGAAILSTFAVSNLDAGTTVRLVNVRILPSGASASDNSYTIVYSYPVAPGQTVTFNDVFAGMRLGEGDAIRLSADNDASVLNYFITGQVLA